MLFWNALLTHEFIQHALLAGILASVTVALLGPFILVRRETYVASGISHSLLGGMGVAYFFGAEPLLGAMAAALIAAIIIAWISLHLPKAMDTTISAVWALGMAIGIIMLSQSEAYNADLLSYLFGNVLVVSQEQLTLLMILNAALLLIMLVAYKQFLAISFDLEFARLRGVASHFYHYLLSISFAVGAVILVRVVGLILMIALLALPSAIANHHIRFLPKMMMATFIISLLGNSLGLALAFELNWPPGATVIVLMSAFYFLSAIVKAKK